MADAPRELNLATAAGRMHGLAWPGPANAPPVVLVHSLGQRAQAWDKVAAALAPRRRVYALDLPGHGQSDPPQGPSVGAAASLLAPALEAVAHEAGAPLAVVAHAYGAAVAAAAMERLGPGLTGALAWVAPLGVTAPAAAMLPAGAWPQAQAARLLARSPEQVRRAVSPLFHDAPDPTAPLWRELSASLAQARTLWRYGPELLVDVPPLLPRLTRLGRAATFVWCASDPVFPAAEGEAAVAMAVDHSGPRHRQVRLLACGHLPMLESPAALARVVVDPKAGSPV